MTQSNPATLRDIADELNQCLQIIVTNAGLIKSSAIARSAMKRAAAIEDAVERAAKSTAALAASGTEAAPVTCESCKSTNTQRYENAGGLKMYSCADCGWHHEVPAQAAASPEGEGREAFQPTKGDKVLVEATYAGHLPEKPEVYYVCYEHEGFPLRVSAELVHPLRQSAAPSWGTAHSEIDIVKRVLAWHQTAFARFKAEGRKVIESHDMAIGWASVELAKFLAQESQTGAAPSPSPLRNPQGGQPVDLAEQLASVRATLEKARKFVRGRHSTISYGPMQLVVEIVTALGLLDALAKNDSTPLVRPGETGAVTEPHE